MVLVPAVALVASARQTPEYEATARVLLKQSSLAGDLVGAQRRASSDTQDRVLKTQAQLAHSPVVAKSVLDAVPVQDKSVQSLLRHSRVTAHADVDILAFSVRESDARLAQRLANEYAQQYTLYREQLDTEPLNRALADAQRQLARLRARGGSGSSSLLRQASELRAQQALDADGTSIVDQAATAKKIRPRTASNGLLGLLLGTLFGVGLALLWQVLDTRFRSSAEIGDGLGLPLLARVPANRRLFGPESVPVTLSEPNSREAEAFRFLRASLEFANRDRGARTIMVTSAHSHEGKSSVAANLAVALAGAGRRVTLVDLDLRRPSLGRLFGLDGGPGLTGVALGIATLGEALATVPTQELSTNPKQNGSTPHGLLQVLVSGPTPPDPGEFHTTLALTSILDEVRRSSDLVVIDSCPLLGFGDAVTLSGKVDAMLLVTRWSTLRRPALAELRRVLLGCPAEKLGFVLTEARLDQQQDRQAHQDHRSSELGRAPIATS